MADTKASAQANYYDLVPYLSHPFACTTIEHLEAMAWLFGLAAPEAAHARVLELGCASGGNLIPMAARHPGASVLGVDLSPVQIRSGQALLARLQVPNAELRALSITDIGDELGQFDYIICHGVYSWVPPVVQEAILRVCARNLAPSGVAFVSYNAYPGWKSREIVRDAMLLRGGPRDTPAEKLAYARGMLEFLETHAAPGSVLRQAVQETLPDIRNADASYLLHEYLEPCNAPCYFKDFAARAAAHGLAYLGDAEPQTMFVQNFGDTVREALLRECDSQVMVEQYLDFLTNRLFRQSLLVHGARQGEIRYRLDHARLRGLHYAGWFATPDGAPLTLDERAQTVTGLRSHPTTLHTPVHKAVAQVLTERYPATLPADQLAREVAARTGQPPAEAETATLVTLEGLVIAGSVRLRRAPVAVAAVVSARPAALPSVRQLPGLALDAGASASACNQWHERVELSLLERSLLPLLDGAHTHRQLAEHLLDEARAGRLVFHHDGQPVTADAARATFAREQVAAVLEDLRHKGMLVA